MKLMPDTNIWIELLHQLSKRLSFVPGERSDRWQARSAKSRRHFVHYLPDPTSSSMIRVLQSILVLSSLLVLPGCETCYYIHLEKANRFSKVTGTYSGLSPEAGKRFGEAMVEFETKYGFIIDPTTSYGRNPPADRVSTGLHLILPKRGCPKELWILKGSNHKIDLVRTPRSGYAFLSDFSTTRETPFIRHLADDLAVIISRHVPELRMDRSSGKWMGMIN